MSNYFIWICPALTGGFTGLFILWLWPDKNCCKNLEGERGVRRENAENKFFWFNAVFPAISCISKKIDGLAITNMRAKLSQKLALSGHPLGFDSSEFLAATIVCAVVITIAGAFASAIMVKSFGPGSVLGLLFGLCIPWLKLDETIRVRVKLVSRELPQAIDLVSLAMQAGMDFPSAINQVALRMQKASPLKFEFEHLRHKLSLGYSRKDALAGFAARIKATTVRQFVAAVIQSEQQGTPLVQVLSVQANVMRTRRSQMAEQAASRAAILILGPLMLIFASVFVLLLGPFAIKSLRGELF